MDESPVIASAVSPQGRNVELTEARWRYIQRHVEMRERQDTLLETIRHPDFQEPDPHPGRERYWLRCRASSPSAAACGCRVCRRHRPLRHRLWAGQRPGRPPEMTITIGTLSFDSVEYDTDADVLYLSICEPRMPAESFGTPEGHNVRYDETGAVIAITIVNAKWLLDRDGEIKLTIPSRVPAADLAPALAG
jgi:uncharacterized protein YuzE